MRMTAILAVAGMSMGMSMGVGSSAVAQCAPITVQVDDRLDSVRVVDGVAYCGGLSTFRTFDVSDPAAPAALGSVRMVRGGRVEAVAGGLALLGGGVQSEFGSASWRVVDVSDAAHPIEVAEVSRPGMSVKGIGYGGGRYAVVCGLSEMVVYDLEAAGGPAEVGVLAAPSEFRRCRMVGTLVYLTGGVEGIVVVDISTPSAPRVVGTAAADVMIDFEIAGGRLIGAEAGGVSAYSLTEPTRPVRTSRVAGPSEHVTVDGDRVYAWGGGNPNSRVYSLSPAGVLAEIEQFAGNEWLAAWGGKVFRAGSFFTTIDAAQDWTLAVTSSATTSRLASVTTAGDVMLAARGASGLTLYDWVSPGVLRQLGTVDTPGTAFKAVRSGPFVYVADGTTIEVVDISDRSAPRIVNSVGGFGRVRDLALVGTTLAALDISGANRGVVTLDVSDAAAPVARGLYPSIAASAIAGAGDRYVYTVVGGSVQPIAVLDVGNVAAPTLVCMPRLDIFSGIAINSVAVDGARGCIGATGSRAWMLDASDPSCPGFGGSVELPGAAVAVTVSGDKAYVAQATNVSAIDVTSVAAPRLLQTVLAGGSVTGVAAAGNLVTLGMSTRIDVRELRGPGPEVARVRIGFAGTARAATQIGTKVYAAGDEIGVYEVGDPDRPELVGVIPAPALVRGMTHAGTTLLVLTDSGISAYDASGAMPVYRSTLHIAGGVREAAVVGTVAYVGKYDGGRALVVDVSDASAMRVVGDLGVNASTARIQPKFDRLWLGNFGSTATAFDVSSPLAPVFAGTAEVGSQFGAPAFLRQYSYRASGTGVAIDDFTLATVGVRVREFRSSLTECAVQGEYLGLGGMGLEIYDLADPAAPRLVFEHPASGWSSGTVQAAGERAFLSAAGSVWLTRMVGPIVTEQPASVFGCAGAVVTLTCGATAERPEELGYQWMKDGVAIAGATGPTHEIAILRPMYAGEYTCEVTVEGCGTVVSEAAVVTLCYADFDCDGMISWHDYEVFLEAWETGSLTADTNGDEFIDYFDYDDFVVMFEAGC